MACAGQRGIVVEITLFCTMYGEELWKASPMHAANNVNGVGHVGRYEVYGLKEEALTDVQVAVTQRIVRELNPFDNVYYEICNEPYERGGMHPDWQGRVIAAVHEVETACQVTSHPSRPRPNRRPTRGFAYNFTVKPETVTLNYGLGRAIGK